MDRIRLRRPGVVLTAIALACGAVARAAQPDAEISSGSAPLEITERELLSVMREEDGGVTVAPATTIPHVVGRSCYNWVVRFHPVERQVVLTEVLTLPGPAPQWNVTGGETSEVAEDRASASTERRFDGRDGVATGGWCVAEGDPVGAYRFVIRQGGRDVAKFDFTVG